MPQLKNESVVKVKITVDSRVILEKNLNFSIAQYPSILPDFSDRKESGN